MKRFLLALAALLAAGSALAAGADLGQTAKQATNWTAARNGAWRPRPTDRTGSPACKTVTRM